MASKTIIDNTTGQITFDDTTTIGRGSIGSLSDVNIVSPVAGHVLAYNGTTWYNTMNSGSLLTDVDANAMYSATTGENFRNSLMRWNWINPRGNWWEGIDYTAPAYSSGNRYGFMQALDATTDLTYRIGSNINISVTPYPELQTNSGGGAVLPDGKIFIPSRGGIVQPRIFDQTTETISLGELTVPIVTQACIGTQLGALCIPSSGNGIIYLTGSGTTAWTNAGPPAAWPTGSNSFTSMCCVKSFFLGGPEDGKIFLVPHNTSATGTGGRAYIYNQYMNTLTATSQMTGLGAGTATFVGGVRLQDTRIFLVPYNPTASGTNNRAYIYDISNDTWSTTSAMTGLGTSTTMFRGGVLLQDGRVLLVPFNTSTTSGTSNRAYIWNPANNTWSTTAAMTGLGTGTATFSGGVLLADGKVLLIPYQTYTGGTSGRAYIYNPTSNTWTTSSNNFQGASPGWEGGIPLTSGKILCLPYGTPTIRTYDPSTNEVNTPAGVFTGYAGAVTLADGRIFCVPHHAKYARVYNPATKEVTIPSGNTFPGGGSHAGGVLLYDGRVFCIPNNGTTARIYNPVTETVTTPAGTYSGGSSRGGVLLPDGRVFMVPFYSTTARIYDPVSDTLTTPNGTYAGSDSFRNGVLLSDGRVFMVPSNSATARIYDPVANTLTTPSGSYPGNAAFQGGVLLPDGRVFCVPSNSTTARIYDPATDTLTTPFGTYPGNSAFAGGILLPDGRVFCIPWGSSTARIYDPIANELSTPNAAFVGSGGNTGGALTLDGRVFCAPDNASSPKIYISKNVSLTSGMVCCPFLNKF